MTIKRLEELKLEAQLRGDWRTAMACEYKIRQLRAYLRTVTNTEC